MNTFDQILEKIKAYETIILHRHVSPDPDAIGSQAGLARSLRLAFPDKKILCAGVDLGDLDWLNVMDDVQDVDYEHALVITTDCADRPRVSDQRYQNGEFIIKIDHHPNVDPYGDINYVVDEAPAASEIVADFIMQEQLPLTKEVAEPLYAGIVGDTGRFMYDATTTHTFEVAAKLMSTGIDITKIARTISDVTLEEAKLQSLVLDYMKLDQSGAAYAILSQEILNKLGVSTEQASVTVTTPGRIKDVVTWNVFVELPDGTFRVHYRSKGPVINELAAKHRGGGHALASGAKAKDMQEVQQIFDELVEVTKEYQQNNA